MLILRRKIIFSKENTDTAFSRLSWAVAKEDWDSDDSYRPFVGNIREEDRSFEITELIDRFSSKRIFNRFFFQLGIKGQILEAQKGSAIVLNIKLTNSDLFRVFIYLFPLLYLTINFFSTKQLGSYLTWWITFMVLPITGFFVLKNQIEEMEEKVKKLFGL